MSLPGDAPEAALVLNVDDDDTARYVKTRILRQAGFVVREADCGAQALELARTEHPGVVVLDVRLPDISGIEVCRRLKADEATADILVLQTSAALVGTEDRVRGLQGGADHYLAQPFSADELVASVQALLRIHRAERSMRAEAHRAQATADALAARNVWLELLAETTADLLAATDVDTMLGQLFERIAPALQLDVYFHYALEGDALVLASHRGLTARQAADNARLALGQAVCGQVARSGRPQAVCQLQQSDDQAMALLRACGLDAYACVPLLTKRQLVGTLGFGRRRSQPFTEDELRFLRTLGSSVAVARERLVFERQLVEQAQRMREADRRKDEFLAMLAHELRNPLAPIFNAVRLLGRTEPLTETGRRAVGMVDRQARQMRRLVEDLLEVSRITRGVIELQPEPMVLDQAIQHAIEAVLPASQDKRQALEVAAPAWPVRLVADPARIAQVLENLLTNAVKFTPAGGTIRVEVAEVRQADQPAEAIEIRVTDNGIGLEPAKLDSVFELFVQVEPSVGEHQGGLGIGLAMVRRLVELHGGSVRAESAGLGQGAAFVVRLPCGAARGLAAGPAP